MSSEQEQYYNDVLSLDYFKKRADPSSKVKYIDEVWGKKPKSTKEQKYANIDIIDCRWG